MSADWSTVIGSDTTLPVVLVEGHEAVAQQALSRTARDRLRRAHRLLNDLRAAGVQGTASLSADSDAILGIRTVELRIDVAGGTSYVLRTQTGLRGSYWPLQMAACEEDESAQRRGMTRLWADVHIEMVDEPLRDACSLVRAMMTILAQDTWRDTVDELGKAAGANLRSVRPRGHRGNYTLVFGDQREPIMADVDGRGNITHLSQFSSGRFIAATGAFGRFLRAEMLEMFETTDPAEVLGPFLRQLQIRAAQRVGIVGLDIAQAGTASS